MISPLIAIDNLIAPIVTAANKVRQTRDALPVALWQVVPDPIRAPLEPCSRPSKRMIGRSGS